MKVDKKVCKLITEIEWIIGSQVYNPYVHDFTLDVTGFVYRYPVKFPTKDVNYVKIRSKVMSSKEINKKDITYNNLSNMIYKVGNNEFQIGYAIIKVLEYLEERYGISLYELEKNLKPNKKKTLGK